MSRIIDNEELQLLQVLKENLPHTRQLDACVGYFNLRGWQSLRTELHAMQNHDDIDEHPERVRLLVGMALSGGEQTRLALSLLKEPDETVSRAKANEMAKNAVREFAQQLTWGVPNAHDEKGIGQLLEDLKSGYLKIKFAARNPLHAKLYVCHLSGGMESFRAIVGSSNFTAAGLAHQGELNIEESDVEQGKRLYKWFLNKWDDVFTIDITDKLIEVLESSWAALEQPSPRLVHLKMAYELSRDARAGKNLDIPEKIAAKLSPWQESAVRVATRMLKQRGLAVIGDVVGLGKTLTGTAIAAAYGERVLVICPKNLESMWKQHLEDYDIVGKVVPLSMTKDLEDLKPYRLVLVDESHNIRHTTHTSWKHIHDYVEACNADVVLLTATMFNADHFDISGQLKIKLPVDQDLGIRPEELIASLGVNGELELAQRTNGKLSTLSAFEQSTFSKDWQRLLGQFLIRRTRKYLSEAYGQKDEVTGEIYFTFSDGRRFQFPKRVSQPLKYQGGPNDPGDKLASVKNFDALDSMFYARYQPGRYLVKDLAPQEGANKTLIEDMMRANSTNGFIKTTVLKRLTSSPMAFFITVEKMLKRAHILKYALENGLDVPIGTLDDKAYQLGDADSDIDDQELPDDSQAPQLAGSAIKGYSEAQWRDLSKRTYDVLKAGNPRGLRWAQHEWFDSATFAKNVTADNKVLQDLVDEFGDWDPAHDSKLIALAERINNLTSGEKLLVFSEYKDTVDYVYKYLVPMCPGVNIGAVSGASQDPTYLARRFSPISNEDLGGLPSGESELQVLLATDVLSEGQNLQDSALVLNWDLPWTIIKIIQRAGRVDRIGQRAPVIHALTFMPHEGVDDRITLIKRLARRLQTNQDIFGGNEDLLKLDLGDEAFDHEGLYDGSTELEAYEGEVDFGSYALKIWDSATQAERDKAVKLPLGVSTTKIVSEGRIAGLVHTKVLQNDQAPVDLLAAIDAAGAVTTITQLEALKATATETMELPGEPLENHLDNVEEIVRKVIAPQAQQTRILLNHGIRKSLHNLLTEYPEKNHMDPELRDEVALVVTDLMSFPIFKDAEDKAREIYRARHRQGELFSILSILELYKNGELLDRVTSSTAELEVVLSVGFRNEGAN
jgi:Helicase conserved C-terminal domain/PLD-like domain